MYVDILKLYNVINIKEKKPKTNPSIIKRKIKQ